MGRLRTILVAGLLGLLGCGPGGPTLYPVRGQLVLDGGEVAALEGGAIEAALRSDPTVRSSGAIGPDGRFTLETLHAGVVRKGARAGDYQVRILPPDEGPASKKRAAQALAPRFSSFESSGLSLQVPTGGEVVLRAGPR